MEPKRPPKNLTEMLKGDTKSFHPSTDLLVDYAAKELPSTVSDRIEKHLDQCKNCRGLLDIIKKTIVEPTDTEMNKCPEKPLPRQLQEGIKIWSLLQESRENIIKEITRLLLPPSLHKSIEAGMALYL